jgi:hypothetical protein
LAVLESAVSWCDGANVSVSWRCKVVNNSAIHGAAAPGCLGEASPREFVLADDHLLAELIRDTSSPFSDLLEMRACILSHPAAIGETKHVRPTRQDSIREAGEL